MYIRVCKMKFMIIKKEKIPYKLAACLDGPWQPWPQVGTGRASPAPGSYPAYQSNTS